MLYKLVFLSTTAGHLDKQDQLYLPSASSSSVCY